MAVFGLLFFALLFCGGGMAAVLFVASKDRKPDTTGGEGSVEGEKFDVRVTSQIVKKVDGNHRYFFRIQNNDSKTFEGDVEIKLLNGSGHATGGSREFNTTQPMRPDGGSNVWIDLKTGPVSVQGSEFGIRAFQYTVKSKGRIVNTGKGTISDQYEDLSR